MEGYGYRDHRVKEFLRREGGHRCVYCAIHENALGGVQTFHVEHYRPKSRFPALENALANLFYSCPICNRFKSNDWPAEPHAPFHNCCYPDPSAVDYTILFDVNQKTGLVAGRRVASKYMLERLYLNRPHLILERRQYFLDQELSKLSDDCASLIPQLGKRRSGKARQHIARLFQTSNKINRLLLDLKKIPSYEIGDVTKKTA
jgi:hypothetical protein